MPACRRPRCGLHFRTAGELHAHMKAHRSGKRNGDLAPVCPQCGKNPISSENRCITCLLYRR